MRPVWPSSQFQASQQVSTAQRRAHRARRANLSLQAGSPDGADSGPIIGGSGWQKGCFRRELAVNRTVSVGVAGSATRS